MFQVPDKGGPQFQSPLDRGRIEIPCVLSDVDLPAVRRTSLSVVCFVGLESPTYGKDSSAARHIERVSKIL